MTFEEWRQAWPDAARSLKNVTVFEIDAPNEAMTEQAVQQFVRMHAPNYGMFVGRNNSGAYNEKKPPSPGTRWGWCNDSSKLNQHFKTSDLIGMTKVKVEAHHLGRTFAVFTALEVKDPNWVYRPGDKRACAQENCLALVKDYGGIAGFINNPAQVPLLIEEFIR